MITVTISEFFGIWGIITLVGVIFTLYVLCKNSSRVSEIEEEMRITDNDSDK